MKFAIRIVLIVSLFANLLGIALLAVRVPSIPRQGPRTRPLATAMTDHVKSATPVAVPGQKTAGGEAAFVGSYDPRTADLKSIKVRLEAEGYSEWPSHGVGA